MSKLNWHGRIQDIMATYGYEDTTWFFSTVLCFFTANAGFLKKLYVFIYVLVVAVYMYIASVGNTYGFQPGFDTATSRVTKKWYSQLFPKAGNSFKFAESDGFRLPDFSYAGYHGGEREIPDIPVKVAISPIKGDNTMYIQSALNRAVGGALLLLPGVYRIRSEVIIPSHTVLRGSGPGKTFIDIDVEKTKRMSALVGHRSLKTVPRINHWRDCENHERFPVVGDIKKGAVTILLKTVRGLNVHDWIIVKNEVTDAFRREYNGVTRISGQKIWPSDESSLKFLRRITGITGNSIRIDQPIPHILKTRDKPHVLKITCMAEEIGLEDLSIGFTTPYDLARYKGVKAEYTPFHNSAAIRFGNVVNGWIKNIKSYSPSGTGIHLHSRGIVLQNSRWITVKNCDFGFPLPDLRFGGNGYVYVISMSNDCLIQDCIGRSGRDNYLLALCSSGNVISGCKSFDCRARNDFHHSLNVANLVENMEMTSASHYFRGAFVTRNRGKTSMGAGITGSDNVFWKILIMTPGKTVVSEQATADNGKGYVIGATAVKGPIETTGSEWREGIGYEAGLQPASLYREQLKLRLSQCTSFCAH